ncbi:MAG: protein-tyrosine-phosphatase [Bacteroidetes bacterium]|nr:protein-tyrosine-phosphatase [Bacteroidota bacterium]
MNKRTGFYPRLSKYISTLLSEFGDIPEERKRILEKIGTYIVEMRKSGNDVNLNFICTHNSRRSHLGQIWATTATAFYSLEGIANWSGGTEATAFNPRAVAAIERAGFEIENPGGDNPHYLVSNSRELPTMECFSKVYNDLFNPQENLLAIMTCSDAETNCPFIPGAVYRVSLTYIDPKEADDTPQESDRYDERCRQIGTELFFLFSQISRNK